MKKSVIASICGGVAATSLIIDRVSKSTVLEFMESRNGAELKIIPGFFSLISSWNAGIAFGMFQGASSFLLLAPVFVVIAILGFYLFSAERGALEAVGAGLIIGGAIGNMIDRAGPGRVFDFLDVYVGTYHWPTFNAADIFVVVGAFLFGIMIMRGEIK